MPTKWFKLKVWSNELGRGLRDDDGERGPAERLLYPSRGGRLGQLLPGLWVRLCAGLDRAVKSLKGEAMCDQVFLLWRGYVYVVELPHPMESFQVYE
jgi:hypothetical protein